MTKLALAAFALTALAALGVVVGAPTVAAPPILFAAHRGGALLWPENSLLAFRNAIELGADFIEFDVHLARDGEVVVIHDPTLERTTTGAGRVRERTAGRAPGRCASATATGRRPPRRCPPSTRWPRSPRAAGGRCSSRSRWTIGSGRIPASRRR